MENLQVIENAEVEVTEKPEVVFDKKEFEKIESDNKTLIKKVSKEQKKLLKNAIGDKTDRFVVDVPVVFIVNQKGKLVEHLPFEIKPCLDAQNAGCCAICGEVVKEGCDGGRMILDNTLYHGNCYFAKHYVNNKEEVKEEVKDNSSNKNNNKNNNKK